MRCEITIRSAVGVLVHTMEEHVSTFAAVCAVLARPDVQARVGPLKHAELVVLCRPVTWGSAQAQPEKEGRAAA
jgi:hypothetical protein